MNKLTKKRTTLDEDNDELEDFSSNDNTKRLKSWSQSVEESHKNDQRIFIQLLKRTSAELESEHDNLVLYAFEYFREKFPSNKLDTALPKIVLLSQIYSLVKNKTSADRSLEELRLNKTLITFKSDNESAHMLNSGSTKSDIYLVYLDEFKSYVRGQIKPSAKSDESWLVDLYLEKILPESIGLTSVAKLTLINKYKLTEKDLTGLISLGLFTIKDVGELWLAIPCVGQFRRLLVECRRKSLNMLRKQKYNELNVNVLFEKLVVDKNRNFKQLKQIGPIYLIGDLIGKEIVRKVISPMGIVIKLNETS